MERLVLPPIKGSRFDSAIHGGVSTENQEKFLAPTRVFIGERARLEKVVLSSRKDGGGVRGGRRRERLKARLEWRESSFIFDSAGELASIGERIVLPKFWTRSGRTDLRGKK